MERAPLVWQACWLPPFGDCGSVASGPYRRAATLETDQAKKGADSKFPGRQPKEKATQLPQEGEFSKQRGYHQRRKGRGPENPAAQEVDVVAAPLASTWLLRQLLGCGQELLELSLCSAPQLSSLRQTCLFGGVSFKSAYARFVSLISNENAAEFITYHETVSTATALCAVGYVTAHVCLV